MINLLKPLITPIVELLGKLLGFFLVYRQGKKVANLEIQNEVLEEVLKDSMDAQKAKNTIHTLSDDDLDDLVYCSPPKTPADTN